MKFAIISDTHDNQANFKKIINWLNKEKIKLILHCGDVSTHDTLDAASKEFNGEIKFVKGNGDHSLGAPHSMEIELCGKKIFIVHFPAEAKKAAKSGKYDLVFYGHTHRAWDEKIGGCHMINPGEAAGHFYKPTFAVYNGETEILELKILEKII